MPLLDVRSEPICRGDQHCRATCLASHPTTPSPCPPPRARSLRTDMRVLLASILSSSRLATASAAMARWAQAALSIRCKGLEQEAARLRSLQLDVGAKRRESASLAQALAREQEAHRAAADRLRTERRLSATARADRDEARRTAAAAAEEAAAHACAAEAAITRSARIEAEAGRNRDEAADSRTDAAASRRGVPAHPHAASHPRPRQSWSAAGSPSVESPPRAFPASPYASRDLVLAEVRDLERELEELQQVLGSPPPEP